MSWNWLDMVVILLAVGQLAVAGYIVMIVLRIKNGPVARLTWVVKRNIQTGKRLAQDGKKAGFAAVPPALRIRSFAVLTAKAFRPVRFTEAPITYASIRKPLALWGTLKASRAAGKAVATADAKAKSVHSRSVAERLGLIPPIWLKIAPFVGYAGTALAVIQEVQKQIPEIRSRLLSESGTD